MRPISLAVLATAVALASAAARADSLTPAAENPKVTHQETDKNRDGRVDREEFHQRQVDIFYAADADKNGNLAEAEFVTLDTKTTFEEMDVNGNAVVSMYEFVHYRFAQFDDADSDDDGLLSVEEVEVYLGS